MCNRRCAGIAGDGWGWSVGVLRSDVGAVSFAEHRWAGILCFPMGQPPIGNRIAGDLFFTDAAFSAANGGATAFANGALAAATVVVQTDFSFRRGKACERR